ncbi:MAG: CotH kinase family protein [Planctomycetes bacterium]|nr:CotH kinase family protein [Planctomycetota bacterium]
MEVLDFSPFVFEGAAPPEGGALQTLLNQYIDMEVMLTLGAVDAFAGNLDDLLGHGKNFYWADFAPGTAPANTNGKRTHFPWDLDGSIGEDIGISIYATKRGKLKKSPYQEVILGDPVFRAQYNNIMLSLLGGPLSVGSLTAFLDDMEPLLTPSLEADLNNQMDGGDVAGHFDLLRQWVSDRHANVSQQVLADIGTGGGLPGDFDLDGKVDGNDFLLWQRDPSVGSLADWEANYGAVAPLSASSAAVPEPTTMMLLGLGCLALLGRRRISSRVV